MSILVRTYICYKYIKTFESYDQFLDSRVLFNLFRISEYYLYIPVLLSFPKDVIDSQPIEMESLKRNEFHSFVGLNKGKGSVRLVNMWTKVYVSIDMLNVHTLITTFVSLVPS